jgi:hypothetical protein
MSIISQITSSGSSNGPILPRIKYNAVKGQLYKIEREQTADGWQSSDVKMPMPVKLAFDFANMEVGPIAFIANKPDFHMVKIADVEAGTAKIPPAPTADHKTSVRVRVYNKELGVREFMVQAKVALTSIDGMYEEAKAAPEYKAGKVPVIAITGTTEVKFKTPQGGEGSSEQPVMAITAWTDRKAFDEAGAEAEAAPVSKPAPAPAAKAEGAFNMSDDTDF